MKKSSHYSLKRSVCIPCILSKLVPLAVAVMGTASVGQASTSGLFLPARQGFPRERILQLDEIFSLGCRQESGWGWGSSDFVIDTLQGNSFNKTLCQWSSLVTA
jgi:hypothetical protein